jgi:hypothetical protein
LFRLWQDEPALERRRAPRHQVVESRVWLGWSHGPEGFRSHSTLIINLSRGGAFVFLDVKPPKDQRVWICLGTPDPIGYVEARVVAIKVSRQGQCAVRLEFCEPCPYGFFEAAVCGLPRSEPRSRPRLASPAGAGAGAKAEGEPAPQP